MNWDQKKQLKENKTNKKWNLGLVKLRNSLNNILTKDLTKDFTKDLINNQKNKEIKFT